MKTNAARDKIHGLILIEVLVVILVFLMLVAMILPQVARPRMHYRAPRITCVNNLKQVGLAFRVWQGDNNDKFPMQISMTNGGTMELVESGTVWRHFQVMSNELNTPKILFCPADSARQKNMATTWGDTPFATPGLIAFTGNTNTSYFIGVDAVDTNRTPFTNPTMFLAGDRNLAVKNVALPPGLHSLSTNAPVSWTRELHVNQGNVLMADASVQQLSQPGLVEALKNTGTATNRLAIP